jgi:uncharacterized membrane protein
MEEKAPEVAAPKPAAPVEPKTAAKAPGNIQGVLAYVPFLFIMAALQRLEDDTLMFHAKNGAGLTVFFIAASFVSAWLHVATGTILMFVWLVPSIIGAFHGYKNEKWMIPGVSNWAQNIPLDKWFGVAHEENVKEEIQANYPTEAATMPKPEATASPAAPAPEAPAAPTEPTNNPNNPNS